MRTEYFKEGKYSRADICKSFNEFIDVANNINLIVRSTLLQEDMIAKIDDFVERLKYFKSQSKDQGDEVFANTLFHFQCLLRSVQSSIRMWIFIKQEDYQEAWSSLVDAQDYKDAAMKFEDHVGVRRIEERLDEIRRVIFPPWARYNSAAFSETIGHCSICHQSFGECDHIEGIIYMGTLCRRVGNTLIEGFHSALVEHPRDRRCIITEVSNDDGRMVDVFTLKESEEIHEIEEGVAGHMKGILLTTVSLDFD